MSVTRRAAISAVAAAFALGAVAAPAKAQDAADYLLATASTGGTYYPVGVAIATLTKVKLQPKQKIGMSAINSAGSGENVRLIREGEAQFAILQGLFGHYAATGTGPVSEPQTHLRSITMLWPNVEHFVVDSEHAKSGTIDDFVALKGSKAALGRQNSGTIGSNRTILANLGMNMEEDFELFHAGYGPSAEALQNGQVEAVSAPAGVPVGALTRLFAAMGDGATLLSFTPDQMKAADGGTGLWTEYLIPAGTYPSVDKDVTTIAQPNFLATHVDLPEEHVYLITKTMYENLAFLQAIHPATKAMAIENALAGLPVPLHPGALRYYQEIGVDVPETLIAQ